MEKYYDLIVELVKAHRKYAEYASILDEIVDDVCIQAKTVVQTIDNEDVVKSYLNRIVSTSMITVPRKLGVAKSRQTAVVIPETTTINETEDDSIIEDLTNTNVAQEDELIYEETNSTYIDEEQADNADTYSYEAELNTIDTETENKKDIQVDRDLVDKMINGVQPDEANDTMENADTVLLSEDDASDLELDFDTDTEAGNEPDDEFTSNETNNDIAELATVSYETVEEEPESTLETTEPIVEEEENTEKSELLDTLYPADNFEQTDNAEDNLIEFSGNTNLDEITDTSAEFDDNLEQPDIESLALDTDEFATFEEPVQEMLEETPGINDLSESSEESYSQENFNPPSYKLFNFSPDKENDNLDEIMNDIKEMDAKNPGKHILEICNAKYIDCKSVSEISESLNISTDDVIEVLNEIIYLVKD